MTDKTPSDAEILELASHYWRDLDETESTTEIELVRAALAKWGRPVVAAAPDERADFERWQTDVLLRSLDELTQGAECPGEYDDMDVHHEWTAWQARANLAEVRKQDDVLIQQLVDALKSNRAALLMMKDHAQQYGEAWAKAYIKEYRELLIGAAHEQFGYLNAMQNKLADVMDSVIGSYDAIAAASARLEGKP